MGKNKDLEFFKKKVKEKNPELYLKSCINTVTCSTEKVFRSNAYVTKQPFASKLKQTVYTGDDCIDTIFFKKYNDNKNATPLTQTINNIVEWISDLKMLSSTFNNYLWQRLIDDGIELPEINDVFFTNLRPTELRMHFIDIIALVNFTSAMISIKCILSSVGCAVCGKTSKYSKYFDEFATAFKMKYYLPWHPESIRLYFLIGRGLKYRTFQDPIFETSSNQKVQSDTLRAQYFTGYMCIKE